MVIIVTLHLLLAVGFMLYFFHVPGNTEVHSKNVTIANNGTQLKVEDSAVTNSNGKRDSPEEGETSEVINKIASGVDTGDSGGTEFSKEPKAQGKTSGSDPAQAQEDTGDSDAAIKTGTENS